MGCCRAREAPRHGACTLVDPSLPLSLHPPLIPRVCPLAPKGLGDLNALTFYGSPGGSRLPKVAHQELTGHELYRARAQIPWVS